LLPGNHDEREALVAAFAHHHYLGDPAGPLHFAVECAGVRIVAIDTTVVDHQHGEFDAAAEQWLDEALGAHPSTPTVVALHHPPFETGIWWMDQICLHGAERVEAVVRRHPHVRLVIAGHQHRPVQTAWGDALVSIAPSTGLEVGLDLAVEGDPQFTTEAPQLALHLVSERRAVTHHTPFLAPEHLLRYSDQGDWDRLKATLRDRPPLRKGGMLG
jgi:3',5'-cyclic-AMP phosphodiesterase